MSKSAHSHNKELEARGEIYGYREEHLSLKRLQDMTDDELRKVSLRRYERENRRLRGRYTCDALKAQKVYLLRQNPFAEI